MEHKIEKKETVSEVVKSTLDDIKKNANLEIMMPVLTRLRKRVREIQKQSQAVNTKIPIGNTFKWHYQPPKMFICGLQASMTPSGMGIITYQTYKMEDGKKKLTILWKDIFDEATGEKKKVMVNASYDFEDLVVEEIEHRKPIVTKRYQEENVTDA